MAPTGHNLPPEQARRSQNNVKFTEKCLDPKSVKIDNQYPLLGLCTLAEDLPVATESDPERKGNKAQVEQERLLADIEEIAAEPAAWGDNEK